VSARTDTAGLCYGGLSSQIIYQNRWEISDALYLRAPKQHCQREVGMLIQHTLLLSGRGRLAPGIRSHYLKQDICSLIQFARAFALAGLQEHTLTILRHAKQGFRDRRSGAWGLHIQYCKEWGGSEQECKRLPEARRHHAWPTSYVLEGNSGDCSTARGASALLVA